MTNHSSGTIVRTFTPAFLVMMLAMVFPASPAMARTQETQAAAAGISLTYHTNQERDFSSFAGDYATQIAIDAFANQLKEFWPDIRHKLPKNK